MSGTFFALNQKYNNLKTQFEASQDSGGGGGGTTLSDILTNGNSAGASDINMNNQSITAINTIGFADNTIQTSAYISKNFFKALPAGGTDILLSELQSNYTALFTNTGGVRRLRLPTTGLTDTAYIIIYNASPFLTFTLDTNVVGRIFNGRFGSFIEAVLMRPLNWVKIAYNTSTTNWEVLDKSFINSNELAITSNNTFVAGSQCNSLFRFTTSTGDFSIFVPDLTLRSSNANGYVYYENRTDRTLQLGLIETSPSTLSTTNIYDGLYGSQTNRLFLPPKTQITVFAGLSTQGTFTVQQRFPAVFTYNIPYSGTNITAYADPQFFDTKLILTGSVATTFFLPDPRSSVNGYSLNRRITITNNGTDVITLNSTNGNFEGVHGSGLPTLIIPINSWIEIYSNGTNWVCYKISEYGWQYPEFISVVNSSAGSPTSASIPYGQIFRSYTWGMASAGSGQVNIIGFQDWDTPTPSQLGLTSVFRRIGGVGGNAVQYGLVASSTPSSKKAMYPQTGSFPITGNVLFSFVLGTAYTIRACQVGFKGVGGITVGATTVGSKLINLQFSSVTGSAGSIVYGTVITVGGVDYTIRGVNSWTNMTITAPAGSGGVSATTTITGILTIGSVFIVSGIEYTITGMTQNCSINSGANVNTVQDNSITFSPVAPAGGFTAVALLNPAGGGGFGGTSNGIYVIEDAGGNPPPASIPAGTVWTIKNDVYAWCGIV